VIEIRLPRVAAVSFCDVGGNGNRGSPHLLREAELLSPWQEIDESINEFHQMHRVLPHFKISM
jgi:hypothetical protein